MGCQMALGLTEEEPRGAEDAEAAPELDVAGEGVEETSSEFCAAEGDEDTGVEQALRTVSVSVTQAANA